MKEIMTCKVVENRSIAPEIHQITFELPVEQPLCPGQFANVYLNDPSRLLPRPIGISRLQGTKLQLVYRTVGGGTALMAKMQPGETLRLSPPLGKGYDLPEDLYTLEELRDAILQLSGKEGVSMYYYNLVLKMRVLFLIVIVESKWFMQDGNKEVRSC